MAHFDACAACRGSRSGSRPDTGIHWNFGAVPAPRKSLRWWLWHGRARVAETYLKGLIHDCTRLEEEPLAVRTAAARVRARCETLYTYLANNMESLVDYGRRYRNGRLCCTNPVRDSSRESSVIAGVDERTEHTGLPDPELVLVK